MRNLFFVFLTFFSTSMIYSSCMQENTVIEEGNILKREQVERIDTIRIQSEDDHQLVSEYAYNHNTSTLTDGAGSEVVSGIVINGTVYIDKPNDSGGRTVLCWTSSNICYEN